MSEIDIRTTGPVPVDAVIFCDKADTANKLMKGNIHSELLSSRYPYIGRDTWDPKYNIRVQTAEDAANLIKALQYAIDNNWFGE